MTDDRTGLSLFRVYKPDSVLGTIGDELWFDVNANGTQDAGEPGIAGVTVALALDANNSGVIDAGEIIATDTTDSAGNYLFTGLPTGKYLVAVTDSNNVLGTMTKTVGSSTGSEGNSQPIPYAIDLSVGENDLTGDLDKNKNEWPVDPLFTYGSTGHSPYKRSVRKEKD